MKPKSYLSRLKELLREEAAKADGHAEVARKKAQEAKAKSFTVQFKTKLTWSPLRLKGMVINKRLKLREGHLYVLRPVNVDLQDQIIIARWGKAGWQTVHGHTGLLGITHVAHLGKV